MNANKDFIIVHTTTEKATIHGKKIKRSKSETWLLKKYLGNDEHVTIPAFITNIGYCAFKGCDNLKKISIQDGVKIISDSAFANCSNLESVRIPKSVSKIGLGAFRGCGKLQSVYIEKTAWNFNFYGELKNCKNVVLYGSGYYFREFAISTGLPFVEI